MVRFIFILLNTLTTVAPVTVKVNCVYTVQHDHVYLYPPAHLHTLIQVDRPLCLKVPSPSPTLRREVTGHIH